MLPHSKGKTNKNIDTYTRSDIIIEFTCFIFTGIRCNREIKKKNHTSSKQYETHSITSKIF